MTSRKADSIIRGRATNPVSPYVSLLSSYQKACFLLNHRTALIKTSELNVNLYRLKPSIVRNIIVLVCFFNHGQIAFPVSTWTRHSPVKSGPRPAVLWLLGFWQMGFRGRVLYTAVYTAPPDKHLIRIKCILATYLLIQTTPS